MNGVIDKSDANFVGGLSFDEILNENVFIGPYPQIEDDVQQMAKAGVTAVINVQTDIDIQHRGYSWPKMVTYYKERGIVAKHY